MEAHAVASAKKRFVLSYFSGFIFWFSLPLGGLALLMIAYLTKTSWGLLLRRPFESAVRTLPHFLVLFVPIMVVVIYNDHKDGGFSPYWWSNPDAETSSGSLNSFTVMKEALDKREQAIRNKFGDEKERSSNRTRGIRRPRERDLPFPVHAVVRDCEPRFVCDLVGHGVLRRVQVGAGCLR